MIFHPVATFLSLLPDLPAPEVILEPDGDIGFDWFADREGYHVVSAHIDESGVGGWAAASGHYTSHGRFQLDHGLPEEFLTALKMVLV